MSPTKDKTAHFPLNTNVFSLNPNEQSRHEWLKVKTQYMNFPEFSGLQVLSPVMNTWTTLTAPLVLEKLAVENSILRKEVDAIRKKLADLEERMPEHKVIVLREISREEARQEIRELFTNERAFYYSDIAEELQLDLKLVVEICHELEEAGEITLDADART